MKPNVLIIIASDNLGGPGKGLLQFIRHADRDRFDYTMANFLVKGNENTEFVRIARERGVNLQLLRQDSWLDPLLLLRALRLARAANTNIIQSHGYKGHVIGFVLSRWAGLKWIGVAHGWTNENRKIRLYNRLERWLLRRADAAITVSPRLYATVSALRGRRRPTFLILNAVDEQELVADVGGAEVRRRLGIAPGIPVLGVLGRLSPEKGQDLLLKAFAGALRVRPEATMLVVGDGPEAGSLKAQTRALGIEARVRFCGHQSAIRDYLEALDLLVLPSRSEGLPNVVLEAMCVGVPVLATDVGGVREIIEDGMNGWIVPPGDAEALESAIVRTLSDPARRREIAQRGRASLSPKFSASLRAARFLEVYEDVLGSRASPGRIRALDRVGSDSEPVGGGEVP